MFKMAPNSSEEHAISENSKPLGLNPNKMSEFLEEMKAQKAVVIGRPIVVQYMSLILAAIDDDRSENARTYLAPDENAKKYASVLVMSRSLDGSKAYKIVNQM